MDANPPKVVLDTNILISAIGFGGIPRNVFQLILDGKIKAIISPILIAELEDVVSKKFPKLEKNFSRIRKSIYKKFKMVHPVITLNILNDYPDNRILEAALEGKCNYLVTGDKELLHLKKYRTIRILTAQEFLEIINY